HHVAVVGEVGVRRPLELERHAVCDRAETVVAEGSGERGAETHVLQLADRPRREPVATGLLAREALLLHDEHAMSGSCQPVTRRGTRGTTTDDERVPTIRGHACALVIPVGRVTRASSRAEHPAHPPFHDPTMGTTLR